MGGQQLGPGGSGMGGQQLGPGGSGMGELRGPGRDAQPGFHHRFLPAQCHHPAARHSHGQVWPTADTPGWQV